MQNPKLGDANFAMSTTYCNDHEWGDSSYDLENLFKPHDEYDIDNSVCNNIECGFGRVQTLSNNDPATLENDQSDDFFYRSGRGGVMTLFDDNPTILEECQLCMHVDHLENMLCDSHIVEFEYYPTCNYYERGKYGCRNFHVTKLPLFMLRLSMFYSSSLHMLVFACFDNLFAYKMPMHRKYVRLKFDFHILYDALFVLQFLSFMRASLKLSMLT
jgi:hypothetical protein